jgi:Putative zinc ribbon domain
MEIPSLPTDSLYKFMFVSGLIVAVYGIYIQHSGNVALRDKVHTSQYKFGTTDTGINKVSIELSAEKKHLENNLKSLEDTATMLQAGKLSEEYKKEVIQRIVASRQKDSAVRSNLNNRFDSLRKIGDSVYKEMKYALEVTKDDYNLGLTMSIGGLLFSFCGSVGWFRQQRLHDRILLEQRNEAVKSAIPCESCGMLLKFDNKHKEGNRYCGICYNGKQFREPTLTIEVMKQRIRLRMIGQGIKESTIKKQLKYLNQLDRWSKEFRW